MSRVLCRLYCIKVNAIPRMDSQVRTVKVKTADDIEC